MRSWLRVGTLFDPQCLRGVAILWAAKAAQSLNVLTVTSQHNFVANVAPATLNVVDFSGLVSVLGHVSTLGVGTFLTFLFYESFLASVS